MKTAIQKALKEMADPDKGKEISSYMKNILPFRGLQQPQIAQVFQQFKKEVNELDDEQKFKLADQLMRQEFGEDKKIGLMVAEKIKFDLQRIKLTEPWFTEGHISEWATADTYCGRVLKYFLLNKKNAQYMLQWAKHENLWLRRSSCVGFVTLANKKKCDMDLLFDICQENIVHQERFNQLGTGWLLRQMSLVELDRVLAFIEKNIEHFSSEGLRYAYEKMKIQDQQFLKSIFQENKAKNQKSGKQKVLTKAQNDSDEDFQIIKKPKQNKKRKL